MDKIYPFKQINHFFLSNKFQAFCHIHSVIEKKLQYFKVLCIKFKYGNIEEKFKKNDPPLINKMFMRC